ncbi:U32 family peptidase [Marinospirillum perlucidum]|uniref:U32 family peptidase n=1 Tax=Marinospirillum perlucidum TaxID=1982602 RepID=UPI00138FBC08|nr:U32 family peptidase [Marinospirillum perlucidum]
MIPTAPLMVGIDPSSDITALLNLGVRQFFAGYLPPAWLESYGAQLSPNRRYRIKEQFTDAAALQSIIKQIHQAGGVFNLTLNTPWSNAQLQPELLVLLDQAETLDVDGVVVGSLSLLEQIKQRGLQSQLILSNLLGVYSLPAAQFLAARYQPSKIVLPRDLSLAEITQIASQTPQMQFEVFLFGDHCRLSEAQCFVEHGYDSVVQQDLCGYAQQKRQHHRRALPDFKPRLLADKEPSAELMQSLAGESLALTDLLDQLDRALFEQDTSQQQRLVARIRVQDTRTPLLRNLLLGYRALNLLAQVPAAADLIPRFQQQLQQVAPDPQTAYFKLDRSGLQAALDTFADLPNITSYKVPMRGRKLLEVLHGLQHSDPQASADFRAQLYATEATP